MADDVIIARFSAELSDLKKEFDAYIAQLEKVKKEEKGVQVETKKTGDVAKDSAKKRTDAFKSESTELKKLQSNVKSAFDVKPVSNFTKEVDKSKSSVKGLSTETQGVSSRIKSSLAGIGAGIIAAFSIQAVSQFAQATITAFIEAEENADRLRFAITQIAGETESVFDRLIQQSSDLQKISIFSDDDIQKAQTALATFGLTGNQIEKLIPKILDLASANKIDLAQATDAAIRSFEGQTRGLLTLGVKFDDTGTRIGNYNKFMESAEKLSGATAQATETLAGQLKQLDNRADELQESIGSQLAPLFTKLKIGVFEATKAIIDFISAGADLNKFKFNRSIEGQKTAIEEVGEKVEELTKKNLALGQSQQEASKNAVEAIAREINERVKLREQAVKDATFVIKSSEEEYKIDKKRAELKLAATLNEKKAIDSIIQSQAAQKAEADRILTAEQLRLYNMEQLNKAFAENKQLTDAISKDNVDLIEKELQARLKAGEKAKLQAAKDLEELKKLNSGATLLIPIEVDFSPEDVNKKIEVVNDKLIPLELTVDAAHLNEVAKSASGNLVDSFLKANEQIISQSEQLVTELSQLYGTLAQRRIESIERAKEKELETIDVSLEANSEALELRRISQTEAEANEKKLLEQKVKAEEAADKKIRELKRKQAIADKAAALIQIAIATARNITEQPGPFGAAAALWLALGAVQAGVVVAQPIPYKKGTKSARGGLSRVDEAGSEMIVQDGPGRITTLTKGAKVIPAPQTKRYDKVFDAMVEDKFEQYVFKTYVTPHLEKQKKQFQESRDSSFARNVSQSMMVQAIQGGKGDFFLERLSKNLTPQAIGKAVADNLPTHDIYRR